MRPLRSSGRARFVSRGGGESRCRAYRVQNRRTRTARACRRIDGGFTDCLLQQGSKARRAVDVGYGVSIGNLRNDPAVTVMERTNFRTLDGRCAWHRAFDIIVVDASFISLRTILARVAAFLAPARAGRGAGQAAIRSGARGGPAAAASCATPKYTARSCAKPVTQWPTSDWPRPL